METWLITTIIVIDCLYTVYLLTCVNIINTWHHPPPHRPIDKACILRYQYAAIVEQFCTVRWLVVSTTIPGSEKLHLPIKVKPYYSY